MSAVLVECAAGREEELGEERLVAGVEGMVGSGMRWWRGGVDVWWWRWSEEKSEWDERWSRRSGSERLGGTLRQPSGFTADNQWLLAAMANSNVSRTTTAGY
jgi:hypothetical protein